MFIATGTSAILGQYAGNMHLGVCRTFVLWLQESLFFSSADMVTGDFLAEVAKAASAELKKRKVS